jgi:flagellar motor protein MotB
MGGLTKAAWFKAFQEAMNNIEQFFATGKAISPINENEVNANVSKL